ALSKQQGATLYMTLLAGLNVVLYRYTGQTDLAVGSPIANRNRPELENLIGFFVNTLVMRSNVTSDLSFAELISQTKKLTMDAYENQDVPFEYLVEALKPERSMSYSPFFQIMFGLQNLPLDKANFAGLELSTVDREYSVAKFDLSLFLYEADDGL